MNEKLLEAMKTTIEMNKPAPDYPTLRYVVDPQTMTPRDALTIPDGPWDMNNTKLPSSAEAARFKAAGYTVDTHGRPLHPGYLEMVTDPNVGVVSGRGRYYHWGPNYTADPILITKTAQPRVLLIKRGDTGTWALPGGFVDPADTDVAAAAKRELEEETGVAFDGPAIEVYTGVVGDRRTTAHAWAETGAYLMQVERQLPVRGQDDAIDAAWVRLDALDGRLFGSHDFLIHQAFEHAQFEQKKPIADILALPKSDVSIDVIDAGHMAYDHLFVTHEDDTLFVKAHDPSRFTDSLREAHSRTYLEKEYALYEHTAAQGFAALPDRVELIDDHLLAMDALHTDDGWRWRAPKGVQFDTYTRDILDAFDQLQQIPIPKRPAYHHSIKPTYDTFWKEGWDALSDEKMYAVIQKVQTVTMNWTDDFKHSAQQLIEDLPVLQQHARFIERGSTLYMAHNDARQSNIAWHPDHGARIIDWSWGDAAPKNADATMFLIDLAKAGRDVTPYASYINTDQAITLIGFWLAHSIWHTRDDSMTVREQQVASAVAAYQLIQKFS